MEYYFVAKHERGGYVGQLTYEEISRRLGAGELASHYVAARATSLSYSEVIQSGGVNWVTVGELVANPLAQASPQADDGPPPLPSRQLAALTRRYADAYLTARVTNGFGGIIKGIAVATAVLLTLVGLILVSGGQAWSVRLLLGVVAILVGLLAGVQFYVVGVLISAQGQILKASLDSAANSSPFLTNEHRAEIMSLPEA